ncbi:MAG: hypothetical protein IJ113_04880 [Eggerthellaceae bacterium]|nr:hypothetical protein [Eggerthellaceae bacterium]
MPVMLKMQREKKYDLYGSLQGLASVIICIAAFLFVMGAIIVVVRFIVG